MPPAADLEHLREILARLGRIEPEHSSPFLTDLIAADRYLSWGGTLMIITAALDDRWLADLTTLSQRGLHIAVALAEPGPTDILLARRYGLTAYRIDRTGAIVPEA